MYTDIIKSLVSLPATDQNFTAELKRATQRQNNGGKNKSRIKACERELKRRDREHGE